MYNLYPKYVIKLRNTFTLFLKGSYVHQVEVYLCTATSRAHTSPESTLQTPPRNIPDPFETRLQAAHNTPPSFLDTCLPGIVLVSDYLFSIQSKYVLYCLRITSFL